MIFPNALIRDRWTAIYRWIGRPYNQGMHHITDTTIKEGQIVLSNLPFPEGQQVRVVVARVDGPVEATASIHEIRRLLKGGVERFDDPFEPAISLNSWEMLK
jgi:hypothetical protein